MSFEFEKDLKVEETNIPGLLVFDLPVHGDNRGWFKENWQRAKMTALGIQSALTMRTHRRKRLRLTARQKKLPCG